MMEPSNDMNHENELQDIQFKSNQVADHTLDSTRRMMENCVEATDSGVKTLDALHDQGQQLNNIEEGLDQINEDMKEAEKNLTSMEKCCGMCTLPFKRVGMFKDEDTWKGKDNSVKIVTSEPTSARQRGSGPASTPSGPYITRITNDVREDEMEDNMTQVGSMLGNLRNMALDMGNEIETQNTQLDRSKEKASRNLNRIDLAEKRTQGLLK